MANAIPDDKTEEERWLEYRKTRNPALREAFIKQYAPLVKYVAGKVAMGMPSNVEFDDLVGFGVFGQIDWVPRSVRQKTREIEATISSLEAQLGRTASDQEIAGALGMNEDEYLKTIQKISGTSILSLNDVWFSGDEKDRVSIVDSIESPSSLNPDVMVEKEAIRQVIIAAINELPEKEKKILILYY